MNLLKLYVTVKQAGKRRASLKDKEININGTINTFRDLICEIVMVEVENYNKKGFEEDIFKFLTSEELEDKAYLGKVSFGERHNENSEDLVKAQENTLLSFKDGIYRVFINDEEIINLDDKIDLKEEDRLVFIKLVMLSGRLW